MSFRIEIFGVGVADRYRMLSVCRKTKVSDESKSQYLVIYQSSVYCTMKIFCPRRKSNDSLYNIPQPFVPECTRDPFSIKSLMFLFNFSHFPEYFINLLRTSESGA